MARPRIFLGSSAEEIRFVDYAKQYLESLGLDPIPWTSSFPSGSFTLESLYDVVQNTEGAIFFLTPDDFANVRGKEVWLPRDNLIFEAGMFLAAHGRKRVALIVPSKLSKEESEQFRVKLPTDLAGLTYAGLVCKVGQDLAQTDLLEVLRKTAVMMREARRQYSEFGLSYQPTKLHRFLPDRRLELVHSLVGSWDQFGAIAALMQDPKAQQIDILVAYRLMDVFRSMPKFRSNPKARLRLCMADMMDSRLNGIYRRKYVDRTKKYLEEAVRDSIRHVLLGEKDPKEAGKIVLVNLKSPTKNRRREVRMGDLVDPPKAQYEIYLSPQRITYT